MRVYIVEFSRWDEHYVLGVFSTHEKASEYLNSLAPYERDYSEIDSWEVR